jgi:hypothetical protein
MKLPPRAFIWLTEAAIRWNCSAADIIGWASAGKLQIVIGITPFRCGNEVFSGLVEVPATEILPLFRRCDTAPVEMRVLQFRPINNKDWKFVTDPSGGVVVALADLMILAPEVHRFEAEHELFRQGHSGQGPERKYDWDGFYVEIMKRVYFHGVPEKQADLLEEMADWFARRSETGDVPDISTIRKRITPVWRMLKEEA